MNRMMVLAAAATILAASGAAEAGQADASAYKALLEEKADLLVSVKFVLKQEISMSGRSMGNDESTKEVSGVVVDPTGLVLMSNTTLGGGMGGLMRRNPQLSIKTEPSDFKVIFPGETKEYDAILGAKDSKLNLAFVQIKDLEGREIRWASFEKAAKAEIGQTLVGVNRLGKGFDYAPYFARAMVTGEVKQPRPMFVIRGDFSGEGLPLFTNEGKVAGILSMQEGASGAESGGGGGLLGMLGGGGGNMGVFMIPAETVNATITMASKQAREALEKSQEEEGDEEKDEGDGEEDDGGDEEGW